MGNASIPQESYGQRAGAEDGLHTGAPERLEAPLLQLGVLQCQGGPALDHIDRPAIGAADESGNACQRIYYVARNTNAPDLAGVGELKKHAHGSLTASSVDTNSTSWQNTTSR